MVRLGAPLGRCLKSALNSDNSEGGNGIDRVELAYIPLPEVVAHVFNAKI